MKLANVGQCLGEDFSFVSREYLADVSHGVSLQRGGTERIGEIKEVKPQIVPHVLTAPADVALHGLAVTTLPAQNLARTP
jgi:hypothetical protein